MSYVSATVAQGCGPRVVCGGSDPAEPPTASSPRSDRSAVGAEKVPESDYQRGAEEAFLAGNYDQALRLGNHALVETPRNGKLHLFVSQILFAKENYEAATAAIHQAASLLETKDWGYVVENFRKYYRGKDYVTQVDQLTKFIDANPDAAYARFLRGYHFGYLGHKETARRELAKAVELEGRDKLAARLLEMFGGETVAGPEEPDAEDISADVGDDASAPESDADAEHHGEHGDHQH
ncbi:MAG: tetratricopeptide repeat protein [Pirellulaceae bacterium]